MTVVSSQSAAPTERCANSPISHLYPCTLPSPCNILVLASANTAPQFALHRYPSLFPAWTAPLSDFAGEELYDADFDEAGTLLVVTSGSKLRVYSTSPSAASSGSAPLSRTDAALEHNASEGGGPAAGAGAEADDPDAEADRPPSGPDVIQTIQNPAIGGRGGCTFRAARFGRGEASKERLFTVVNAANAQGKGKARKR